MSPVLVDSNVVLDIVTDDPRWGDWSASTLAMVAEEEILIINALVYIGAHAAVADYRLLTRDASRYRSYFPRLQLISPNG